MILTQDNQTIPTFDSALTQSTQSVSSIKPEIHTLVIKAIRACNLRCNYCYYINEQTQDYGKRISMDVIHRLFNKLAEYIDSKEHQQIDIVWHGGEPLLLGRQYLQSIIDLQRQLFAPGVIQNHLQTNGVLIDDQWAEFFLRNEIGVGVSLDLCRRLHDEHRLTAMGKPTYDDVIKGIRILAKHGIQTGVLGVLSGPVDGEEVIDIFRDLGIASCDLLLPMSNVALRRRVLNSTSSKLQSASVSDAMLSRSLRSIFRAWTAEDNPGFQIRIFDHLIYNALGFESTFPYAGPSERIMSQLVIVETDGSICLDTEFSEIDRFGLGKEYKLGPSLFDKQFSFHHVAELLLQRIRDRMYCVLPEDCKECPARSICRGCHPGSRFDDTDNSFNHASSMCKPMYEISLEIAKYLCSVGYEECIRDPLLHQTLNQL